VGRSTRPGVADILVRGTSSGAAGPLLVALAALGWGLSGGIGGILLAGGWNPFTIAFYRGAVGLLFVCVWLLLRSRASGLADARVWFWSALAGLGVAGNFSFYFISIEQGSVAIAAMLMYCAPVFVYLVSFALGLESASVRKGLAIALVLAGILLLTRVHDVGAAEVTSWGIGAGVLSGLSYALFIFGFKYAAPYGSPQAILTVAFAVLVAVLIGPAGIEPVMAVPTHPDWPLFAALGVLGAGVSFVIYVVGLRKTAPAVAAIVAMVEPVTASAFAFAVLDQRLTASQLSGMALILVTVTAMSVASSGRPSARFRQPKHGDSA
jgi:drug/metabolite transporter (DMT)-like permease